MRDRKPAAYVDGKKICGARVKTKMSPATGKERKNKICHRAPVAGADRCHLHGGKSTGPKSSLGYYKKTILKDAMDIAELDPFDLQGEIAVARAALEKFHDDPLKVFCARCRRWVIAEVKCPYEAHDDKNMPHPVHPRDNDYSEFMKAIKILSEVSKNFKEIQRGKEVTIKIEILNFMVTRVVQAYEETNMIGDPDVRRRKFVEAVDALILDPNSIASIGSTSAQKA